MVDSRIRTAFRVVSYARSSPLTSTRSGVPVTHFTPRICQGAALVVIPPLSFTSTDTHELLPEQRVDISTRDHDSCSDERLTGISAAQMSGSPPRMSVPQIGTHSESARAVATLKFNVSPCDIRSPGSAFRAASDWPAHHAIVFPARERRTGRLSSYSFGTASQRDRSSPHGEAKWLLRFGRTAPLYLQRALRWGCWPWRTTIIGDRNRAQRA
ncbi:hypothetical protein C8Q79DRAFT_311362 [Trametes meyenii]|nr:hypothetical protein C8Q79DRAFT_311362 [Trametes meyenii]